MKIEVKHGTSRLVLLIGPYAVKIPHPQRWHGFLYGLIANSNEAKLGRLGEPGLCPVLFSVRGGWLVVMPRCEPLGKAQFEALPCAPPARGAVEHKRDSFGLFRGRVVAVDYG